MANFFAGPAKLSTLLGCALLAGSAGCEKKISQENIEQANKLQEAAQQRKSRWAGVTEGMTEKEVESVLGQPAVLKKGKPVTIDQPVEIPIETYIYEQDGKTIELHFLDGKLQGRIPQFGEAVDARAPLKMNQKSALGGETAGPDLAPLSANLSGATSGDAGTSARETRKAVLDKIQKEEKDIQAVRERSANDPKN